MLQFSNSNRVMKADTISKNGRKSKSQMSRVNLNNLTVFLFALCLSASLYAQKASDYNAAAEKSDKVAQFNLAECYLKGNGVTKDYKQAAYWYRKAADQGYDKAQLELATLYLNGNGVPQDDKQGFYWYHKAAKQGNALAQFNLAICYEDGTSVTEDTSAAYDWYAEALKNKDGSLSESDTKDIKKYMSNLLDEALKSTDRKR